MLKTLLRLALLILTLGTVWAQPDRMLERITSELNLTPTQVEQIRVLLKDRPPGPPGNSSSPPSGPPPGA